MVVHIYKMSTLSLRQSLLLVCESSHKYSAFEATHTHTHTALLSNWFM